MSSRKSTRGTCFNKDKKEKVRLMSRGVLGACMGERLPLISNMQNVEASGNRGYRAVDRQIMRMRNDG